MENFLATSPGNGNLKPIENCWVMIPGINLQGTGDKVALYSLPEISEAKGARYSDQTIQGRAAPVKTYSYSENRTISFTIHLWVTTKLDISRNLKIIRGIASLTHPEYNGTYLPPRIARLYCGKLLSEDPLGVPVVLKNYEVSYDNSVQWFWSESDGTYMPLHVAISCQFDVVYSTVTLPGAEQVLQGNY